MRAAASGAATHWSQIQKATRLRSQIFTVVRGDQWEVTFYSACERIRLGYSATIPGAVAARANSFEKGKLRKWLKFSGGRPRPEPLPAGSQQAHDPVVQGWLQVLLVRTADRMVNGNAWDVATMDHVVARCKGGTNDDANLVSACRLCNCRRSYEDPRDCRKDRCWDDSCRAGRAVDLSGSSMKGDCK